jgi:transcription elongation GreA/GreB family factor
MIQLEREKLGAQIKVLELNQKKLHSIKAYQNSHQNTIGLGSIVFTDKANYYISIAADFCKIDSKIFYCISSQSPIGRLLIGKTINDSIKFNGTDSTIHKVL